MWVDKSDDGGEEHELIVPGQKMYLLSPATGRVRVDDGWVTDATWYLDYSELEGDEVKSQRYVTSQDLSLDEAKEWAMEVAK